MTKASEYWNSYWPDCFWGNDYASLKGRILEDLRNLERREESLESENQSLREENKEKQKTINNLENKLKENDYLEAKSYISKINKLNEDQQEELNNLLETYTELINNKTSFVEKQFERSKNKLLKLLSEKEFNYLLQLHEELGEKEIIQEAKIEVLTK